MKNAAGASACDLPQFVLGRMGPIERISIWVWQAKNVNQEIHLAKMAHYTGSGDKGTTSIIGRCGINKDDARIEALGSFDELNATVGVVMAFSDSAETVNALKPVRDDLHTACAELAAAAQNVPCITEQHIKRVESMIAEAERCVEPQRSFILPGGSREAALLHLARTVARRAERQLVKLANTAEINPLLLKYANRLSSLFHIMARVENKASNVAEENPKYEFWNKRQSKPANVEDSYTSCQRT